MRLNDVLRPAAIVLCVSALGACSGGSDPKGTVSVSLMDRPVDGITELHVTISEVWLKPQGEGAAFKLVMTETPKTVDLLELGDENASVLVDEAVVPAGTYNWIEMKIDDTDVTKSYAMTDAGGMEPVDVDVPSGSVRFVSGFEVGENQAARFLFDWDVRKGLTEAVGQNVLLLRPAFRILDVDEYGSISGTISSTTAEGCGATPDSSGMVVYVFEGEVTPDDMDGAAPEPLTTADPVFDVGTGDWSYRTVVMPGSYTVALACDGDMDTDLNDETLTFADPADGILVDVTAATPVEDVNF
jgi:hypothetical protein